MAMPWQKMSAEEVLVLWEALQQFADNSEEVAAMADEAELQSVLDHAEAVRVKAKREVALSLIEKLEAAVVPMMEGAQG